MQNSWKKLCSTLIDEILNFIWKLEYDRYVKSICSSKDKLQCIIPVHNSNLSPPPLRYNFHSLYIATSIGEKPFKACRYIFLYYVIISCLYDIVIAKYQNKKKMKKKK